MSFPDSWCSGYADAGIAHIHHVLTANQIDEPIVMAHGFTDNWQCLAPLAEAVDRDAIMCDLRGHGMSDAPAYGYGPESFADDLAAVCRDYDSPVLYGHSLGAEAAARVARRDEVTPKAIILEDPPAPKTRANPTTVKDVLEDIRRWHLASHADLREEYACDGEAYADALATARKQVRPEVAHIVEWPYTPLPNLLDEVPAPTLVLRPDPDEVDYLNDGHDDEWVERNATASVTHIPGAGHTVVRDSFGEVVGEIRSFLEER